MDIRTLSEVKSMESDQYFNSGSRSRFGISATGRYCAVGSRDGSLVVFDIDKGEMEDCFDKSHQGASIVACDWQKRTGSKVASLDNIGNLFIWE